MRAYSLVPSGREHRPRRMQRVRRHLKTVKKRQRIIYLLFLHARTYGEGGEGRPFYSRAIRMSRACVPLPASTAPVPTGRLHNARSPPWMNDLSGRRFCRLGFPPLNLISSWPALRTLEGGEGAWERDGGTRRQLCVLPKRRSTRLHRGPRVCGCARPFFLSF